MLASAFAQLRYVTSVAFGIPFDVRSLERLVRAMRETQREFGPGATDGTEPLGGLVLDDETRREMQLRRFRQQASKASRETRYYGDLFERLALDPRKLRFADIQQVPLTPKEALRADPDSRAATPESPLAPLPPAQPAFQRRSTSRPRSFVPRSRSPPSPPWPTATSSPRTSFSSAPARVPRSAT